VSPGGFFVQRAVEHEQANDDQQFGSKIKLYCLRLSSALIGIENGASGIENYCDEVIRHCFGSLHIWDFVE
jgi:hypothetical protein